jgi:protein O-mannosyl-transferase
MRSVVAPRLLLAVAFAITALVYRPGLSGGFLFDDYPNIVDNVAVQPHDASVPSLVRAALSSPSSDFKRPLASLSFAANYLATGLDPYWMKLTNLAIHLLNGLLVFLLARSLLAAASEGNPSTRNGMIATLIAAGWMLLPINLTGVLYVVQRMESMANLFVLLGLLGYARARQRMLAAPAVDSKAHKGRGLAEFLLCVVSITIPAALGLLAKETAVMLPFYALLVEGVLFRFRAPDAKFDRRLVALFTVLVALPLVIGLAWLAPRVSGAGAWAARDFTLSTRLLTEARIVSDYVGWTLLPTPGALSFYHDDFSVSAGLLSPWTTLAGTLFLAALAVLAYWLRNRRPLAALGTALYLGCHLLTGTVLPLELIYEHRNYFASFGLLLSLVPLLAERPVGAASAATDRIAQITQTTLFTPPTDNRVTAALPMARARYVLLAGLMLLWTGLAAITAHAWGNPLHLAEELAARAPRSPRAQYELGRTYIIYSHYDPASPFVERAYAPLERAAALPNSSILAEQALIFMNSRMHKPLKDAWWDSMVAKLKARKPGVQDESSLGALTQCAREHSCDLPRRRMVEAFMAAIDHPNPSARLLAIYGDYAWNVLDDHLLGERMTADAVKAAPNTAAYRITRARMLIAEGQTSAARDVIEQIQQLNVGGSLDGELAELRKSFRHSTQ